MGVTLVVVERHKGAVRRIVADHHAANPRIVGSTARRDVRESSDLDVLVDFTDDATILDEVGLRLALTDLFGTSVDVIAADAVRDELHDRLTSESYSL